MTDAIDPEAAVAELVAPGDCYCSWLTADEINRREGMAVTTAQSRTEAVRLLRVAEEQSNGDPGILIGIAMAWKDLARLH